MANYIARGVESVDGAEAVLRTVPEVSVVCEKSPTAFRRKAHLMQRWMI
jgi:hypothetical protein